ncbi:uncharacterized protein [Malus domestica]|uniref:uncharacterized protein isoform X2 n=1 Tax=Malus domestica TaxID=3750 RepID=UPI0039767884
MKERSREMASSRVFCFIPFLSSKKLIIDSQTLPLSRTATPGAAAAQRLGLQRRRFVKPSLLSRLQYSSFGFSSDFTIVNWAASATGYRASFLSEYRVTKSDLELALIQFANDISFEAHVELRISKFVETSCDLLQEIFRKENTSTYRRLCLTLAYLKPRNHRHQQLWLRTSLSSSIPPKFHCLSLLSPTHCVSILPGWCSLGTWCGEMQACCSVLWCYDRYLMKNLTQAAKARATPSGPEYQIMQVLIIPNHMRQGFSVTEVEGPTLSSELEFLNIRFSALSSVTLDPLSEELGNVQPTRDLTLQVSLTSYPVLAYFLLSDFKLLTA